MSATTPSSAVPLPSALSAGAEVPETPAPAAATNKFKVISPEVVIVGKNQIVLSKVRAPVLLKLHKIIIAKFKRDVPYPHAGFKNHVKLLHSLNDMYPSDPTTEDIELFRVHIVKFVGVWFEATRKTRLKNLPQSVQTMKGNETGAIQATIEVENATDTQYVKISKDGNLSLEKDSKDGNLSLEAKKPEPTVAADDNKDLADLKAKIEALKTRINECKVAGGENGEPSTFNTGDTNCNPEKILNLAE